MEHHIYLLSMICMMVLLSSISFSMHDENNYFHEHESIIQRFSRKKNISNNEIETRSVDHNLSVYDDLEKNKNESELKNLKRAFSNVDDLFRYTPIKIQKYKEGGVLSAESKSNLFDFLAGTNKLSEIINNVESCVFRKLNNEELFLLKSRKNLSFHAAVKLLWEHQFISDQKAQTMLLKYSVMTPQETIKLIENGAVKTSSGYLVQLRTGSTYGDALKLFNDVALILKRLKEIDGQEFADINSEIYCNSALSEAAIRLLSRDGFNVEDILSDAYVIREMRKHFLFISRMGMPIKFRLGMATLMPSGIGAPSSVNTNNDVNAIVSPKNLSALLIGNYYIRGLDASMSHSFFVNPLGASYSGSLSFEGHGLDWWLYYTDGFLGGGSNYTVNFDQGTFWSNGQPSFLAVGLMAGGWRDYLVAGFSLSTVLSNTIGLGLNASMSISRAHDVTYLGQYPMDGKFAAIRGLHKVEINDSMGINVNGAVTLSPTAAINPVAIAFRAGKESTKRRIFRTHTTLDRARAMLSESDTRGVFFLLGKKIKESRPPAFENPENLIEGDELVEIKTGKLFGAFVIGLQSLGPIAQSRIGGAVEMMAEFELGLRKFPNDKYEVSIEPKEVFEIGFFANMLNLIGAGYMKSIAVARKQIFMFDFLNPEAKKAYFDLIHHGRLPTSEDIEVYSEDRGPEYLLTEFRAQNQSLLPRGIARTYLEKVRIETSKKYIGLSAPLIPAILHVINKIDKRARKSKDRINVKFEGIDREFIRSHAKSVATNGLISVRRSTFGGRKSEGQGFSGRYNQDLFVTHRRIHAIDDSGFEVGGNKWQFDSLVVHGQLEDTIITGDEENAMAEKINRLFGTFIGSFAYKNSHSPRVINIEREFSRRDLNDLTQAEARDLIPKASQATGIEQTKLMMLVKKLENKHPDHQGVMIKEFIEEQEGFTGFAAIHQLLGAKPEHLYIRTEGGYTNAVMNAKKFIATYSDAYEDKDKPSLNLSALNTKKNRKKIRSFYLEAQGLLREIDTQLRLLYDDKYLVDDASPLVQIYGKQKVDELVSAGIRQDKNSFKSSLVSARKVILELMNLKEQDLNDEERKLILRLAGKKMLMLEDQVELLLDRYENVPVKPEMSENYVRNRYVRSFKAVAKIERKINDLSSDLIMQHMDKDYVDTMIEKLKELRKNLTKTISLNHLSEEEKNQLKRKIEKEENFLYKLIHRRRHKGIFVDGALAKAFLNAANVDTRESLLEGAHGGETNESESEIVSSPNSSSAESSDSEFN